MSCQRMSSLVNVTESKGRVAVEPQSHEPSNLEAKQTSCCCISWPDLAWMAPPHSTWLTQDSRPPSPRDVSHWHTWGLPAWTLSLHRSSGQRALPEPPPTPMCARKPEPGGLPILKTPWSSTFLSHETRQEKNSVQSKLTCFLSWDHFTVEGEYIYRSYNSRRQGAKLLQWPPLRVILFCCYCHRADVDKSGVFRFWLLICNGVILF